MSANWQNRRENNLGFVPQSENNLGINPQNGLGINPQTGLGINPHVNLAVIPVPPARHIGFELIHLGFEVVRLFEFEVVRYVGYTLL